MNSPRTQNSNPPPPKSNKPFTFFATAFVAVLVAICLNFTHITELWLKLNNHPFGPNLAHKIKLNFLSESTQQTDSSDSHTRTPCVLWMAPFISGGGYSSEAWSYVTALTEKVQNSQFQLKIEHHGDLQSVEFWYGLPEQSRVLAIELHDRQCSLSETVVVCHSEPGAWYPPLYETLPCPPTGYGEPLFVIGRTMFETDRLNAEHVSRCNRMDQVWVPTDFHVATFVNSGVDAAKVVKMVQPVDVEFFDPRKHEALVLPDETPVLRASVLISNTNLMPDRKEFVFFSVFKWEYRKGWDVLLKAYLEEFSKADKVSMYLLTNAYHSDNDFTSRIVKFVDESGIKEPQNGWPPVYVIDNHVPQKLLPALYKAADAFVLPSRGEGWGRPIVEAMAMELPVIVTNWSGPTEYLTEDNGYPLPVYQMSEVKEGAFKGHRWAEPSTEQLKVLMRHVVDNPVEARRKGNNARHDMIKRFSPEVVGKLVAEQITVIVEKIVSNKTTK